MKELLSVIGELDAHIDLLTEKIEKTGLKLAQVRLLKTMPGVGIITALTVVAEVGDFSRFGSANKLAAFAGLVPKQRSSGEKVRFGSITHSGSKYLRTAMVETAMRIREENAPELYQIIDNLKQNCGAKKARVALARKMLTIMWSMVKNNKGYNPNCIPIKSASFAISAMRKGSYLDGLHGA